MSAAPRRPWIVLGRTEITRWGGDLRRRHIFQAIVDRTGAVTSDRTDRRRLWAAIRRSPGGYRPWRPPRLATGDLLTENALLPARWMTRPVALDLHDEPVLQATALGRPPAPERRIVLERRIRANLALFPIHVVPSASFAALVGLDPARVVVAPNGSDTEHIQPGPFPAVPTIGLVSGAAPNRGIEAVMEAATLLRETLPELRLRLWLAAGDEVGRSYVAQLQAVAADRAWIEVGVAPYEHLGDALATATVLVVPHPVNDYLDVAVPVKLADSMAAGRPVVVTPRLEAARIVRGADCGAVSDGDDPAALAAVLMPILEDATLAAHLGANARAAAVRDLDWRVISARVADEVFARVGSS